MLHETFPDVLNVSVPFPVWCKYLAIKREEFPKVLSFRLSPSILPPVAFDFRKGDVNPVAAEL